MEALNRKNAEEPQERLRVEIKDKKNILINRIVSIAILSIAFLLGFWGIWQYKNTTYTMDLIDKANASKQSGRYEEALGFYTEVKLLSPDFSNIDTLIKDIKRIIEEEERRKKTMDLIDKANESKQSGRYEEALGFYTEAKSLSPDFSNIDTLIKDIKRVMEEEERRKKTMGLIDKANVSKQSGRYEEALSFYTEAKSLSPDFPNIDRLIADINKEIEEEGRRLAEAEKRGKRQHKTRNEKVPKDTEAERRKKTKPSLNSNSIFAAKYSRIYHKSNCTKLNTEDLIEFTSPQKARKAGGIPCKYCNPSSFVKGNTLKVESSTIFDITNHEKDSDKFDLHYRVFPSSFQETWYVVNQQLNEQKEKTIQQKKKKGIIVTDLTRHGIYGFPHYDKYYLVIEEQDRFSTKVNLKLFSYYREMKHKNFAEIINDKKDIVLLPDNKTFVNKRAKKFLDKITKALAKNY